MSLKQMSVHLSPSFEQHAAFNRINESAEQLLGQQYWSEIAIEGRSSTQGLTTRVNEFLWVPQEARGKLALWVLNFVSQNPKQGFSLE